MSHWMTRISMGVMTALALGVASQNAQAALVACPASHTAAGTSKVTSAGGATAVSACQYLTPPDNSNVANIANINAAGFFGFSDWVLNTGQGQIGPGGASGSWSISAVDFANRDYIMVFKDGSETNLIAFSFNELFSSGNWATPFTEPPFSFPGAVTQKDVSHYTIAYRANPTTEVPEPATLALLGAGLLGLGALRRRRAA